MPLYLYVKQHIVTGLKYLGKTTNSDPYSYPGSGVRWRKHLDKHGYQYTTTILKECQDTEELKTWGRYYSDLWNVAESKEWANLKTEEGQGGELSAESKAKISAKNKGKIRSQEYKRQMSVIKSGQKYGPQTEEHKRNNAASKKGRTQPEDAIRRRSLARAGRQWYNNGRISILATKCPEGFTAGRIKSKCKGRPPGSKWFTNGLTNFVGIDQPEGFREGMTRKKKV